MSSYSCSDKDLPWACCAWSLVLFFRAYDTLAPHFALRKGTTEFLIFYALLPSQNFARIFFYFTQGELTDVQRTFNYSVKPHKKHPHRRSKGNSFGWDSVHRASFWTWLHKLLRALPSVPPLLACVKQCACNTPMWQLHEILWSADWHQGNYRAFFKFGQSWLLFLPPCSCWALIHAMVTYAWIKLHLNYHDFLLLLPPF